ncbi:MULTISPECIES: SPFH domain-containing protein [unclassified Pseudomonas]|uniref:SPFH domain-containing protein n=1 Tax=unclassified Pseudomonas TaxID=196821 RepID=UPI000BCC6F40|nr:MULTISPECIES: SPFH domain-containing protein [unclassified Pseudomonas]PVZ10488.1 regulator of protease activity HflC (stomatin/prohibitin superfamily) [Pseudomonas sp. URIL14HWK12:I12]PVZ21914.1 regulator of protease activity HflC (stomatin/prohibitin superfamily) [Pseudomonas sp. URIL14HWK12:I10]PVZ31003.1 regulator of protease activity HflC (stomatin/prohibitin superfamily) [Pseudomonas sp. URIL14HWK12:I11]SNZ17524.1 Regulator of protease activity HflC, stomatin/prohibitin superfamily [Ps
MTGSLILTLALIVFVFVSLLKGVRIVPQGEERIVERLGRYHTTLQPGLNFTIPYVDRVRYILPTKDIILDVQQQEIITRDNAVIVANALCFAKVVDPKKAAYGVENYQFAVTSLTMTALRAIIGTMDLDEALSSREIIKARLAEAMTVQTDDWGIAVRSVEIQDIKPSESMQVAMERQAAAERERKAAVTRAEGERQAAVLAAQARKEAAERDAAATVQLAEASAVAIERVSKAVGTETAPALFLLGERYITAMQALATSTNSKTVVLPADIQQTLGGLLGKVKP